MKNKGFCSLIYTYFVNCNLSISILIHADDQRLFLDDGRKGSKGGRERVIPFFVMRVSFNIFLLAKEA